MSRERQRRKREGQPRQGDKPRQAGRTGGRRYPANAPLLEVGITRLGGQGDGLAEAVTGSGHMGGGHMRPSRTEKPRPLFVPFTLPGETVKVRPVTDRGEGVACELVELVTPAAGRAEPACSHFMTCGGCAVQHLPADLYAAWKQDQVARHLARVGLDQVPLAPIHRAAPGTRRRAGFVLRRIGGRLVAGFHERASNRIVELTECPVLLPEILALLAPLRALFASRLAPGEEVACTINAVDNGLDMLLRLPAPPDLSFRESLAAFAESTDLARLSCIDGAGKGGGSDGGMQDPVPLAGRRRPSVRFGQVAVTPPPGAFLQATREGETAIQQAVREGIGPARKVLDLYAGCGTLSLSLAETRQLVAVEGDEALLAAIRAASDAAGLGGRVRALRRDLARQPFTERELSPFDAVILDPPRAGARAQCIALAASPVPKIVYVSCNPATFARDARTLTEGGYRCTGVAPIDQFLWTPHIELVGCFERAGP